VQFVNFILQRNFHETSHSGGTRNNNETEWQAVSIHDYACEIEMDSKFRRNSNILEYAFVNFLVSSSFLEFVTFLCVIYWSSFYIKRKKVR
jgi:hypothetical protein